ncbi:MAG TPA: hypothetical protein VHW64_08635 [Nocardioides sp.]|uniref:hypothetical protein n=1 Tax=Nocardioides sp. TaxID=35761 RepID=UPI002E2F89CA|nr:hypothetical protein [Nocardioides sp.]HEX3930757.1 hypothetical protein [Nocardioides sp.]
MHLSRRVRSVCVAACVAALMAATGAITYAATAAKSKPSDTYAAACANTHHKLRLVSSGACPKGYSSIKLAVAPTPLAVSATSAKKHATVGNFTFTASCFNDMGGQHAVLQLTSPRRYVVQGNDVLVTNSSGSFSFPNGVGQDGAGLISFAASTQLSSDFRLVNDAGVTGNLVIIQSGHTLTLTFALFAYGTSCSVQTQITPSR